MLALAAAVFLVLRAVRKDDGVLERNREFGARFIARQDPYFDPARGHRVHGPYPPSYVLVTAPLALVPEPLARGAWAVLQIAALASCFVLVQRWLSRGWPECAPHASVIFALALLLASRFLLRDMAGGGGNILYAVLALWGIEFALRDRNVIGGGLLALSLVLKPNLAPLVLFLVCRRRWRALGATTALALVLFAAPALWYGVENYARLAVRWIGDVAQFAQAAELNDARAIPDGFPLADTSMNQSLREALWRAMAADMAAWIARLATIGITLVACLTAVRARGERAATVALTLFLPVSLLISPISWKAHHVVLLGLFVVLIAEVWASRRRWVGIPLVVYYVTCVLLSEELVGKAMKNTLQEISVVTLGALALFALGVALVFVLTRARQDAGGAA
ncbi:MAG: DUF2029 domain-containing protein [Planctomycetes bacterium]|nr:DUF2029 domain-containing protein [Planctomycetota bacterium]